MAVSLLIWKKEASWKDAVAVTTGAILPDVTMFLFYGYQKLIGSSEGDIWGQLYFLDHWQYFFDVFNSIPIALVLLSVATWFSCRWGQLLMLSAIVHMLFDLPLHHDDGHRHFLPISNWRFESPVSYWDPKHFGMIVAPMEFVLSVCALIYVSRTGTEPIRKMTYVALSIYGAAIMAALAYFALR
jgi:hypothetical protein